MISTEVESVGTDISVVSTEKPIYVTLNSRPYVKEFRCRLCSELPEAVLVNLTLDLVLYNKPYSDIITDYQRFITAGKPTISEYALNKHKAHSSINMLSDTDRKALQIHSEKVELLQKILRENGEEFNLDTASIKLIKETHESFVTLGAILQRQERELVELESGVLPEVMKDTYQRVDPKTGEITTMNLYPLIEKKRREVLKTTDQYMTAKMDLQRLMRDTLKIGGDQSVVIAVNQIFHNLTDIEQGLKNYLGMAGKHLKELGMDDTNIHKFMRSSIDFIQKNVLIESYKIESILRDMLQKK